MSNPIHLDMATGNRAHAVADRGHDLYETPSCAVRTLLAVEYVPMMVWEPCCGPGAIVHELRAAGRTVHASDLIDYGCPGSSGNRDFLMEIVAPCETIITNPPFKLAEAFVEHSLRLCPTVMLMMRLAFLEGLRWNNRRFRDHLARVWVFTPRLPMMHRAGWDGPVNSNSGIAFAWFVFRRDWVRQGGRPAIDWVNWREIEGVR